MVNYAYQDYFYKTSMRKDILVVDGGATVTAVSGHEPSISGATYVFTTEDFKSESFELEESICSEEDLKFGLCESSFVRIEVKNNPSYPNLKDAEAELKIYIYFDGDSDTLFQIGKYIVEKDEYSDDRRFRTIEMYDFLYYLRDYDITPWYNNFYATYPITPTIGDLRNSLFTWLNSQELGEPYSFPQETTTLINDPLTIGKTIESDVITFDFFMQGILEANGCMGHVNRNGEFVYKYLPWYSEEAVKVVTDDWREPPTKYEDITTIGIGFVDIYDQNNFLKFEYGSTSFKHPSRYSIVNSFVFADKEKLDLNLGAALIQLRNKITHLRYKPCEVKCQGDLCLEVGDQINVQYGTDGNGNPLYFYTYILERSFRGIQSMRDVFSAKGNKRQPVIKLEKNSNWQTGSTTQGTDGSGTGGVADVSDTNLNDMIEYWRNIGIRLLDEPTGVSVVYNKSDGQVELKWTDPADITTKRPEKVEWLGTVVVRKENSAPKHRWDGDLIVNSTTRDEYKTTALVDNTVEANKRYYYGIFPYHRHLSDVDNNINFFRFTKVVSVNTVSQIVAPSITSLMADPFSITVNYNIPTLVYGSYTECVLVYKKGNIPTSKTDGTSVSLDPTETTKVISGLDETSTYYFIIYITDSIGNSANSDVQDATTGENPVPPEYRTYINQINGSGFYWKDWEVKTYTNQYGSSWVMQDFSPNYNYSWFANPYYGGFEDVPYCHASQIYNVYVTKEDYQVQAWQPNTSYTYDVDVVTYNNATYRCRSTHTSGSIFDSSKWTLLGNGLVDIYSTSITPSRYGNFFENGSNIYKPVGWIHRGTSSGYGDLTEFISSNPYSGWDFTFSYTTSKRSLLEISTYLGKYVRNVNLYVNGILWSRANNTN